MLKMSCQLTSALLATSVNNSKVISNSGGNNKKLAKSDFTKLVLRVEEPSFITPNAK